MTRDPKETFITPDMTVLDVVSRYRTTEGVFKRYDDRAGTCICCEALFETLDHLAQKYDLDLNGLLEDLEEEACRSSKPEES